MEKLLAIDGIRLASVAAGIRYKNRNDLVLVEMADNTRVAAMFTQNAFCAAPVSVAKRNLAAVSPRYLLINVGNANAGTGEPGVQAALACCDAVANAVNVQSEEILPFSTGVIGEPLPAPKIVAKIPQLVQGLDKEGWEAAASAIMTTDTVAKGISLQGKINNHTFTVTGIAKGAGMICPNMATLLVFLATDASLSQDLLQQGLKQAVAKTFNSITVDGDTSTNDACVLMATGRSTLPVIEDQGSDAYNAFIETLVAVCEHLATSIVRDAEGATKLVTIQVQKGASEQECMDVAYAIAHSPLVKTALFASDPNWGRILAAVGRAGVTDFDINRVQIFLDDVCIVSRDARDPNYTEQQGQRVMQQPQMTIKVMLGRGDFSAQVWTCDFSYDYVKINAEYRT